MTVKERFAKFDADFERLKRNREQVPLQKLQTTYAEPYNALVAEITAYADWYAEQYLGTLLPHLPRHPKDTAGNEWLDKRIAAILQQEARPGGLVEKRRAALIDRLDKEEFELAVYQIYERCLEEAFDPYWQRHNRWVGKPENRWIYNDIIERFWLPPGKDAHWPDGAWIDKDYNVYTTNWPPHIKEDTEKEADGA